MPLFLIERGFAEQIDPSAIDVKALGEVNSRSGVRWLYSFLSADKRKTYCLYESDSEESIRAAARNAGLPVDAIIELSGQLTPEEASVRFTVPVN